jgi:peptide/nickel transport system substrate-binding protein
LRLILSALFLAALPAQADDHAIAMHGQPYYPASYQRFDYTDQNARKGGDMRLSRIGTFDSVHPYLVRGVRAAGLGLTNLALLQRSMDEPFSLYAGLAARIEAPADRRSITFHIRESARFHDGREVMAEDVAFTWKTLRDHGRPNHRNYYKQVERIEVTSPRSIRFDFKASSNRELPLIMGLMPVLSKAEFETRPFNKVTLKPLQGTGPYKIEKIDAGHQIIYRRIEGHWTENLPAYRGRHNFARHSYDYFRDKNSAREAFRSGAIDVWVENDARQWAEGFDFPAAKDGRVKRQAFTHQRPVGMYGLAFNTRRAQFSDIKVRHAIGLAFDFEWLNKTLFHGAYHRTRSFFENSELAAVMTAVEPQDMRTRLHRASRLLKDAGWRIDDDRLISTNGTPFGLEIMLANRGEERIVAHLAHNLKRLGIEVELRIVDSAQYQARANDYDFDAMIYHWGASLSPGNEQAFYWASDAAARPGTRNYPGIKDPALDRWIGILSDAPDRESLIEATQSIDQILLSGYYVVPFFHQKSDRVMYWDNFLRPAVTPIYGYQIDTWWKAR